MTKLKNGLEPAFMVPPNSGSKCTTYVTDPEGSCPQSPSAELHTTEEQVNLETQVCVRIM